MKRLQGWEPARTITIDDDGVQTVVTEPEWDDTERDSMLALAAYEATLCPICGGPASECQSPEAETRWKGTPPTRCHRTDAIKRYQENAAEYPRPAALLWGAEERG